MFESANISIFAGSGGQVFAERMCKYMGKKLGSSEVITFSEGNTFVRSQLTQTDGNRSDLPLIFPKNPLCFLLKCDKI